MAFRDASIGGGKMTIWVTCVILSALQRRPLFTQMQTLRCIALIDTQGHVWTAPAVQEESDVLRSVRVQPCIRPIFA
jgi:hypothetical protein